MTARSLPDFPWDALAPYAERARAHPGGLVDLSVGTPVDPTPESVQQALRDAADSPGYPLTAGTPALREAAAGWFARQGVPVDPAAVLPTIGSKELVAWLPTLLGRPGPVWVPEVAYPTYEVGALLAGALVVRVPFGPPEPAAGSPPALIWLNSPANPTGQVATAAELAAWVAYARSVGAVLASDECYLELDWAGGTGAAVSLLHPDVTGGDHTGLLVSHSLSKRSNLAGYRAGIVAGDPALVAELLAVRKHAGMIVPGPVQAAAAAAYRDDAHAVAQRERYRRRRDVLAAAVARAGLRVDHSAGGLYLWCTAGREAFETVGWLAERGILAAPGAFYGPAGAQHVRLALTATDERIAAAADRLVGPPR